jgi:predicted ABC-type ATPase
MLTVKSFIQLTEGVNDKGIFKAVFMAGAPGSGKDTIMQKALGGHGYTEINSDQAFEHLMKKRNLSPLMPDEEEGPRNVARERAKDITSTKEHLQINGRKPIIINGTGHDTAKLGKIKKHLESMGYETHMLMVHASNTASQERNVLRGKRGGRTIPDSVRLQRWDSVQAARPALQGMFGDRYHEYDNSHDESKASPELLKQKQKELDKLHKHFGKVLNKAPTHPKAIEWIQSEKEKAKRS